MSFSVCLSPVMDPHSLICFLFMQSLTALSATRIEIPQAGLCPVNGCSDPVLARSAVSFPAMPLCPGTHISYTTLPLISLSVPS